MKTVFIANRNLNFIRERELISEGPEYGVVRPHGRGCGYVTKSGPVHAFFDTYDEALAWIKSEHLRSIAKMESELSRMRAKHKHPVRFDPKP